jgi:hypothetical protein
MNSSARTQRTSPNFRSDGGKCMHIVASSYYHMCSGSLTCCTPSRLVCSHGIRKACARHSLVKIVLFGIFLGQSVFHSATLSARVNHIKASTIVIVLYRPYMPFNNRSTYCVSTGAIGCSLWANKTFQPISMLTTSNSLWETVDLQI